MPSKPWKSTWKLMLGDVFVGWLSYTLCFRGGYPSVTHTHRHLFQVQIPQGSWPVIFFYAVSRYKNTSGSNIPSKNLWGPYSSVIQVSMEHWVIHRVVPKQAVTSRHLSSNLCLWLLHLESRSLPLVWAFSHSLIPSCTVNFVLSSMGIRIVPQLPALLTLWANFGF